MILTAYFDESTSDRASVVAGVMSTAQKWKAFEQDWAKFLAKFGVNALHMKEFAHFKKDFESWRSDEAKRIQFLSRAIEIIRRRCDVCVGMLIDRQGFSKTIAPDASVSAFYQNEYTAAAFMSMLLAGKWADRCAYQGSIDFVFDRGNPARKQFEEAYDNVCKIPKERAASHIGALSFADDKEVTPLQAADFVAYEMCKVYTDLHLNKKRIRGSLRSLFQQVNVDVRVSVEKNMAKLVASCNAPMEGED